ncbi:MAG: hypothetical protein L6V35_05370 [Alistipes putredinis]|nr:MAG: hypothetical protein L6V35_05370 [Alistipes putredinis]
MEEIAPQYVKYRKWENPDGPVYVMDAALVDSIKFGNGTVEVFRDIQTTAAEKPMRTSRI